MEQGRVIANVIYTTEDHLGSSRINTDKTGAVISRHDYMPFGEKITSVTTSQRTSAGGYAADTVRKQFTEYENDVESALDFEIVSKVVELRFSTFVCDPCYRRFSKPVIKMA
jgi:hypothetical protein